MGIKRWFFSAERSLGITHTTACGGGGVAQRSQSRDSAVSTETDKCTPTLPAVANVSAMLSGELRDHLLQEAFPDSLCLSYPVTS